MINLIGYSWIFLFMIGLYLLILNLNINIYRFLYNLIIIQSNMDYNDYSATTTN